MILRALLRWILSLILIIGIFIVLLITPFGLKVTMGIASKLVPGKLRYESVSGVIFGPLQFRKLRYDSPSESIKINSLELNWKPSKLLKGQLHITHLNAKRIVIVTKPQPAKKTSSPPGLHFKLPLPIQIDSGQIDDITITNKKNPIHINTVKIHGALLSNVSSLNLMVQFTKPYAAHTHLIVSGTPSDYKFQLNIKSKQLNWHLTGQGNQSKVHFQIKKSHTLKGTVAGDVTLNFTPTFTWQATLHAKQIYINEFNPTWPSPVTFDLVTDGKMQNHVPQFNLRGSFKTPHADIQLDAKHHQDWYAKWNISVGKLSHLLPHAKGQLKTTGTLNGSLTAPHINATFSGQDLAWKKDSIGNIHISGNVDMSNQQRSSFQLDALNVSARDINLKKLTLNAMGLFNSHQIDLFAATDNEQVKLHLRGGWRDNSWSGKLSKFNVEGHPWGSWQLTKPVQLNLSQQAVRFSILCLRDKQNAKLCLQGNWHADEDWAIKLNGSNISANVIVKKLHPQMVVQSTISLNGTIAGVGKKLNTVNANLNFSPGYIYYAKLGKGLQSHFQKGQATVNLGRNGLQSKLRLQLTPNDYISGNFNFPDYHGVGPLNQNTRITGNVNVYLHSMKLINALIPRVLLPQGRLLTKINLSGTISNPIIAGNVDIQNGWIKIPDLGITLTNTKIKVNAKGNVIIYTISAKSNGGNLIITGKTDLKAAGLPTNLLVNSDNLLVLNTPEYKVYATITGASVFIKDHNIKIVGDVIVPKGMVSPKKTTSVVTLPDREIVFIGRPPTEIAPNWNLTTHLNVTLGKDVKLDAIGIRGNLIGSVLITNTPDKQMIGNGSITLVVGSFTAYGQKLTFSKGSSLVFRNSPLADPNLSVRASKTIKVTTAGTFSQIAFADNIIVGLNISGTLKNPEVLLFSQPPTLSQADILSYLILGYAASSGSPGNITLLSRAVSTLNLGKRNEGPGGIVDQIRQGLGFSEFGIESESILDTAALPIAQSRTAFVVGRQITRNIYLRYSLGISNLPGIMSADILQLRYRLSPHWLIQTESSRVETGFDILYTIQK